MKFYMKQLRKFVFFTFSIAAMLLISCGGDDDTSVATDPVEQTEEEKQLELLSASVGKCPVSHWTAPMQRLILVGSNLLSNRTRLTPQMGVMIQYGHLQEHLVSDQILIH